MAEDMIISIILSVLVMVPVFLFSALGVLLGQKSGVLCMSVEGVMTFGGIMGLIGVVLTQSLWLGLLFGFVGGMMFGVLESFLAVNLRVNQAITGFGLWFLGIGISGAIYTIKSLQVTTERFSPIFLSLDPIFYVSIAVLVIVYIVFSKTKYGLVITSVGIDARAADIMGINVFKVRWICTVIGMGLMGIGGSYLALNFYQGFGIFFVAGYGWISFSISMVSRWLPSNVAIMSLLFSFISGLQIRLQVRGIGIPPEFMNTLPYISVVVVLTLAVAKFKQVNVPSALGVPYERQ